MIEKWDPRLKTDRHRSTVDFAQYVTWQIRNGVTVHQPFLVCRSRHVQLERMPVIRCVQNGRRLETPFIEKRGVDIVNVSCAGG
jgi:hypothetical protein